MDLVNDLKKFRRKNITRGIKIHLQEYPLWVLALRILNFKFFKKSDLNFIENKHTRNFLVYELVKLKYTTPYSSSSGRRKRGDISLRTTFENVKNFDSKIFLHFWRLEVLLIINNRKEIIRQNQMLSLLKKYKKFKSGEIENFCFCSVD